MRLEFHPQVASDIARIMHYYEDVAGRQLADEFYSELRSCFQNAADSPEVYDVRTRDLISKDFPITFCSGSSAIECALLVRHHRRRSSLGLYQR
jgi:plasmid stabilization system protein ParE